MSFDSGGKYPVKTIGINEPTVIPFVYTGAGASDLTKKVGNPVIKSVTRSGTGAYTINLNNVGGTFLGARYHILNAAGASNKRIASTIAYSASGKTVTFEVSDLATPTLQDLTTANDIFIELWFSNSAQVNG